MARKTKAQKDRTSIVISAVVHGVMILAVVFWLSTTETGQEFARKILEAVRSEKKEQAPEKPKQTTQKDPPKPLPKINEGVEQKGGGGTRRAVASDAPAAAGESFFADTREQTKGPAKEGSGGKEKSEVKQAATAAPQRYVPPPILRPPPASSIKQLLADRAKASSVVESFGTEQISKAGVSDASEIVSRISGASLADGKFAVVRGLADRYTLTTLNGADIPSADPNRRAVQLDLFPAQFISKVDVNKTFQPDLPGGFAGGAINIVTRSFPERPMLSFSVGTSYNTQSSLRDDYLVSDHGKRDWLAMDDGTRELPGLAAATSPRGDAGSLGQPIKDSFGSRRFGPVDGSSPLNSSLGVAFGDSTHLFGRRLGFLAGVNYKNDYNFYDDGVAAKFIGKHPTNSFGVNQSWTKADARSVTEYTWGSMVTLAYEPFDHHELGFNFLYVQTAEDEARQLRGAEKDLTGTDEEGDPNYLEQNVLHWTERNLTYFQLQGKHDFPHALGLHVEWVGSMASTYQDEPDHRIFQFFAQPGDPDDPTDDFYLANGNTKPSRPTRIFRRLEEENRNIRSDWTLPVVSYNSQENSIKSGFSISESEQTLDTRAFEIFTMGGHPFQSDGNVNGFLSKGNNRFVDYRNFPANFQYEGQQTISAWYGMGTWSATEWLRFVGGARVESTDISVDTVNVTQGAGSRSVGTIKQDDVLPAINATIALRTNLQLRVAWSQTVVRPTYREISRAEIYDVALGRVIRGNPDLIMSSIKNYDARLEWYPRPGELVSVGGFFKKLDKPIEQAAEDVNNEFVFYQNYDEADVFGFEIELRKNIPGFLGRGWDQFSLGFNYAYIKSVVDLTQEQRDNRGQFGDYAKDRPLYDQPEFVVNGDLTWDNFISGTSITLNGGVTGRRLVLVGLGTPDEYEEPAPYLDVSLSQKLGRHCKLKLSAKNLLNPTYEVSQTWPSIGHVATKSYKKGMGFGASLSWEF